MKTPITIITGYLGSGKTTLLRNILESGKKIAVVMNEFGAIDIDAKIIKGKNVNIAELAGGCVCCSISGEFELAVKEIIEKARPKHIIVETTGVVDPESLIYDVLENMDYLRLDSVVCIVDCDALAKYPEIGITSRKQIEMADILLLNKTDLVAEEQLNAIESRVRKINGEAPLYKTVKCNIPSALIFGIFTEKYVSKQNHKGIDDIESFVFTAVKIVDKNKFEGFVSALPRDILRAKGFVNFPDGTYLFNYVNGRCDFEKWAKEDTKIVFIGKNLEKVKTEAENKLG
ncbi:MAG: GTP-binding protein [Candidatus Aenigmarchaeota archaeon]|nr:GTP-binding protein [Candidatus Aenigmarchaeota archaeon]